MYYYICGIKNEFKLYYFNVTQPTYILQVSVTLRELGLGFSGGYAVTDLFDSVHYGTVLPDKRFKVDVNPSGVVLVRCEVVKATDSFVSNNNPFQNQIFHSPAFSQQRFG